MNAPTRGDRRPGRALAFAAVAALVAALAVIATATSGGGVPRARGQPLPAAPPTPRGYVRLAGGVPAVLGSAPAGLVSSRSTAAQRRQLLPVTLVLNRRDPAGFARFLAAVRDPGAPQYRHFLSQGQLTARFGPSRATYDGVLTWARSRGLRLVRGSGNRLTLTFAATRDQLEGAFAVRLADFRLGGRDVYANTVDPALPASVAPGVESVVGLSNAGDPIPRTGPALASSDQSVFNAGGCNVTVSALVQTGNPCTDTLADSCWGLLKRYFSSALGGSTVIEDEKNFQCAADELNLVNGYVSGFSDRRGGRRRASSVGAGEKIGLLEFDTFHPSDVSNFLALTGADPSTIGNLSEVPVDGGLASPGAWESEVLLDIDAVMSLAPAAQVAVYDAPMGPTGFVDEFNAMVNDQVNVISNSWVTCEDLVGRGVAQAIDAVLQQAAAAGISVLNSSGDEGASCYGAPGTVAVPADSPSATAVGGSTLTAGPDGTYGSETWWDGSAGTPQTGQGGFGVSRFFVVPPYQSGIAGVSGRSIPDIVSNADPTGGYEICQADAGGCPTGSLFGGTSVSAPMMAALVADLSEQLGRPLGNLNPLLYPMAGSGAFHSAARMGSDFAHVGLGSPNLDGMALAITRQVPGPVDSGASMLEGLPVSGIPADGATPDILVAKLTDSAGNTVSGKNVTLTSNSATASIAPAGGVSSGDNGTVVFQVTDTKPETVSFTATDTDDPVTLPTLDVRFVSPPADTGGIGANPTSVTDDGKTTSTVTVTLTTNNHPAPGKQVTLQADPGTHSSIVGPSPAVTDSSGQVTFAVSDATDEQVTYTATDVTDDDLPVPGSAQVDFAGDATNQEPCAASASQAPTAAAGFDFTNFATNFATDFAAPHQCEGPIGLAFDSSGRLFVADSHQGTLYGFGPSGGTAGSGTLVGSLSTTEPSAGLAIGKDAQLYAGESCGDVVQLDPATAQVMRTVAPGDSGKMPCPTGIAIDPLSGDLFTTNAGGGTQITRISDPSAAQPTVGGYATMPVGGDGISFAPDGTIYVAGLDGSIYEVTGTGDPGPPVVTKLASVPGHPDGIAVGVTPGSTQASALFVNTNSGTIVELSNLSAPSVDQTTVFSGGSRGDFLAVGPDGCVYATQSDRVIRLTRADRSCPFTPTTPAPQINLVAVPGSSVSAATGSPASFRATLENASGAAGVPITFTVQGANPQHALVDADSGGAAPLAYTGLHRGHDVVVARANVDGTTVTSQPVDFSWSPGRDVSAVTLSASPTGGTPGQASTLKVSLLDESSVPAAPIAGASVRVSLQGQACTAQTDAAGNASCSVTPPGPAGLTSASASYDGDSDHAPATTVGLFELAGGVPPESVLPPVISGIEVVGAGLTCSSGTWANRPTPYSYTYQWNRDGAPIAGATASSYVVGAADAGHALTCTVTASNSAGTGSPITSTAVAVPTATAPASGVAGARGGGAPPIAGSAAASLILRCAGAEVALLDVYRQGSRVILSGAAQSSLIGRRVTIVANGRRPVAAARIAANGFFTAAASLPPARNRGATRYAAEIGSLRSLNLKLTRRLVLEPPLNLGGGVRLTGQVLPPLNRPIAAITVTMQTSCNGATTVRRFRPGTGGRYSVLVAAPGNAAAAIYRLRTTVRANQRSRKRFPTFSLPEVVELH